eukprot:jgi/Chlat1/4484/Chrsp29S04423
MMRLGAHQHQLQLLPLRSATPKLRRGLPQLCRRPARVGVVADAADSAQHSTQISPAPPKRFAVIGAGFAGIAIAYHLLQHARTGVPVAVDLYDAVGIAGGASGVAGGLLHPYSPKGKLLWYGGEGFRAAKRLVAAAEEASIDQQQLAWRCGILRPALNAKQALDFKKNASAGARCLSGDEAVNLVLGLAPPPGNAALHIPEGIVLDPSRYLKGLWEACRIEAKRGPPGSDARLRLESVSNLAALQCQGYTAIVVAAGAAAQQIAEVQALQLPLSFCRGRVLRLMAPEQNEGEASNGCFPEDAPSIVGSTWIAAHGPYSMTVGATKEWGEADTNPQVPEEEARAVSEQLLSKASDIFSPVSRWQLQQVNSGVRAMLPRTDLGSLPLARMLPRREHEHGADAWVAVGLGARGLVHHAWLGEVVAAAVLARDESLLPVELRRPELH